MNLITKLFSSSTNIDDFNYSTADCLTCQDPCDNHKQLPLTMQKKIDQSELFKTFKPYKYHLLLRKNDSWEVDVNEETFKTVVEKTESFKGRIMNTLYNSEKLDKLVVLPNGIQTQLESMDKVLDFIMGKTSELDGEPISQSHIIMVCTHMKRDKRCGVAGPMLIEEFEKQLSQHAELQDKIMLLPVSHFGGHKFAGNIIIYRRVKDGKGFEADWYGRVKTCHVEAIIRDCIKQDLVIQELFRGRMF